MLPEPTRRHVGIAYLLFRVADTFEDASHWPREMRTKALADFCALLREPSREDAVRLSEAEMALARKAADSA
jgi:farnesyl-diphosphate farnesyltransferase